MNLAQKDNYLITTQDSERKWSKINKQERFARKYIFVRKVF